MLHAPSSTFPRVPLQHEARQAAEFRQTIQQLQQQLHNSKVAAKQGEQQLQEQVQQLRRSSSDKENSLVQLQQRCQSTEIQLQVCIWLKLMMCVNLKYQG